jgi:hypothetical protein
MPPIQCFMAEPSGYVNQTLTSWAWVDDTPCPLKTGSSEGAHEAEIVVTETADALIEDNDPRYPTHCACGYEFQPADEHYSVGRIIYKRPDAPDQLMLQGNLPPGAMLWSDWKHSKGSIYHEQRGGGPHLHVMTPGGMWDLDSIASNGPGWKWSGTPPNVTALPSIITGDYHGWLRDGVLIDA